MESLTRHTAMRPIRLHSILVTVPGREDPMLDADFSGASNGSMTPFLRSPGARSAHKLKVNSRSLRFIDSQASSFSSRNGSHRCSAARRRTAVTTWRPTLPR
ncbi:hypothetical protein TRVL_05796 [Trypanosoma vivax]|nr:hypothetical protein TRVL_05796 [Trypanosoma vivax]